jgi:hypothetical protein
MSGQLDARAALLPEKESPAGTEQGTKWAP